MDGGKKACNESSVDLREAKVKIIDKKSENLLNSGMDEHALDIKKYRIGLSRQGIHR